MTNIKTTDYQDFTNIDTDIETRRKLNVGDIWANQVKCKKCGEVIRSKNRHDYTSCKCGAISIDGGSWYGRRIAMDLNDIEDMSINYNNLK